MLHINESTAIGPVLHDAQSAYEELKDIGLLDQETFWILGLDASHKLILKEMVLATLDTYAKKLGATDDDLWAAESYRETYL